MSTLSALASFDDLRRCITVLTDGTCEEEFLRFAEFQEKYRQQWLAAIEEAKRLERELNTALNSMADLETKLFYARRYLESESKAKRDAEHERDQIEKKMIVVANFIKNDCDIRNETRDKLAFLDTFSQKQRRSTHQRIGDDVINSTGSFLSDLSVTQSEDDFLDGKLSKPLRKFRPSMPKMADVFVGAKRSRVSPDGKLLRSDSPQTRRSARHSNKHIETGPSMSKNADVFVGSKRSRVSSDGKLLKTDSPRRSTRHSNKHLEIGPNDKICATTTVSIPHDGEGAIRAESVIHSIPFNGKENDTHTDYYDVRTPLKSKKSPMKVATPSAPPLHEFSTLNTPTVPFHLKKSMMRQHNFASKTFLRTDICTHCQKKIRFGSLAHKCRDCHVCCHFNCSENITATCVPQSGTPTMKGPMGVLSDYAPAIAPMIPALIVHCVSEIETRGLNEIGIYRVSGSEREVKALKERLLRNKAPPNLANEDIHVICGCIKDFLRSLSETLIPTSVWRNFSNAVQSTSDDTKKSDLLKAIDSLPQANRDTLAFLILHFQRISVCPDVKMPIDNLARVFGPTIVGYSSPDPDQHAIFTETMIQFSVMQSLISIETEYWCQFVALEHERVQQMEDQQQKLKKTPSNAKETFYSLYSTPFKGTLKKRKFYATPPYSNKKK